MSKSIITVLLMALLVPTLALAQPGPGGKDCDGGRHFRGHDHPHMGRTCDGCGQRHGLLAMADEIGLTDEQKAKIKDMQSDFQMVRIDQQAEMKKAQLVIRKLRSQDEVSETELFRAIDEAARLKAEMQKMSFRHHEAVKAVLTAEQLEKAKQFRHECRMEGRRGGPGAGSEFEQLRKERRKHGQGQGL